MIATRRTTARGGFGRTPVLSRAEESLLIDRVQRGDFEARDHLIRANLGLVVTIARRYLGRGLSLEDLVGEGNIGLIQAVEGFDPARGTRFTTYAGLMVKKAIFYALTTQVRMIRLPADFSNSAFPRFNRKSAELANLSGAPPSTDEVGEALGWTRRRMATFKEALAVSGPVGELKPWSVAVAV